MSFNINHNAEIIASTPKNFDHYVGFHDIKPFNIEKDNLIVLHRLPLNTLGFLGNKQYLEICLWDFKTSKIDQIDTSNAWSWEQGSRLQWLDQNKIIYNKIIENKLVSCVKNISDSNIYNYNYPIYSISKDGKNYLSINYSRLWHLWKSYGYEVALDKYINEKKPKNDGVFIGNFKNDNKKLLLSIDEAVECCGLSNLKDNYFFLTHPMFSPSGDKSVSLLRYFLKNGVLISYLICTSIHEARHKVLAREKIGHFEWINNEKLVVYCRDLPESLEKFRQSSFFENFLITKI